ncbi:class I adenylate-forming enzyme family protein [Phenylobacterium sp.]|uniref:class I adenylate-forming enzyme family protein n=1 Tax=Phenylobacterium sp. TaxID=1871053 RepID=UPI00301B7DC7
MTRDEALARLTGPGEAYELIEREVLGRRCRVFRNAPESLRELFEATASDAPFLAFEDERFTFLQTWTRARSLATWLARDAGVGRGDRVAIAMRNYPEWMIAFQAITAIGAVAVALNALWTPQELAFGVADSGARVLIADPERIRRWREAGGGAEVRVVGVRLSEPQPDVTPWPTTASGRDLPPDLPAAPCADDDATILYTSGSTGRPKGVVSTHRNILSALLSWELDVKVAELRGGGAPVAPVARPAALLAIPLFHVTGLHSVFLSSFRAQRRVVSMYRWDPAVAADLIAREEISQINAPAAVTGDLLEHLRRTGRDLPSLRLVGGGGAARAPEQVRAIPEVLPAALPVTGWGMTETNAIGAGIRGRDYLDHPGSVGQAAAVLDLRVKNEAGDPGAPGELQVRGASVMRGYWGRPDADAEVFDGEWLRTGDVARIDPDGYVWIVDRIKDLIIRGGENIACATVEAALLEHPMILEAAVFAAPDARLGEVVGAAIFTRAAVSAGELGRFLEGRLAHFEMPAHLWVHAGPLPRTASGKLFKHDIRDAILNGAPAYRRLPHA